MSENLEGAFRAVQDAEGVHFEKRPDPVKTGTAYVEPEKAKTRRELELQAGRRRIAEAAEEMKHRPPRVISEAEARAQPTNTPIFRPNSLYADRVASTNGMPVNQALGALMRRVGTKAAPISGESAPQT